MILNHEGFFFGSPALRVNASGHTLSGTPFNPDGHKCGYRSSNYAYRGYGYGRRAIVHPERLHWTPYRGLHTHGHLHVPHRGHYHTFRY